MRVNLKVARNAAKLKQREVAKLIGISVRFYQNLESGKREGKAHVWDTLEDLFHKPQRELRENTTTQSNSTTSKKEEEKKK